MTPTGAATSPCGSTRSCSPASFVPPSDHCVPNCKETSMKTATAQLETAERSVPGAIHSFRVNVPESELAELRRRIVATKWPERETVTDVSQGVQLATM